jgi:glutaredoxin 3
MAFHQHTGFEDVKIVEIDNLPEMDAIQDYCMKLTGGRSVPRVWIDQKFVGGADAVEQAYKSGSLS